MKKITDMAHELLSSYVHKTAICADFTMGNGYDTRFFAERATAGTVYAFDIQEEALTPTKKLLNDTANVRLILDNHLSMDRYIQDKLDAAIFNFGYLPNGSTTITTDAEISLSAVKKAFRLCKKHALLILVCYPGHAQGAKEAAMITKWCESLDAYTARIMKITMMNKPHAPFLFAVEKLSDL